MTGARADDRLRCPDCGGVLPERDPLTGWWCCDDCALAIDDDGRRLG